MEQRIRLSLAIAIPLLVGCLNLNEPARNRGVAVEFYLADSSSTRTTIFDIGEDIYFHYSILNNTGTTQDYAVSHSGPFVSFKVFKADSLIGTSDDGFSYLAVAIYGKLLPGHALEWVYSWFSNENHSALPAGEYTAWATPNLWIHDIEPSSPSKKIDFVVLP